MPRGERQPWHKRRDESAKAYEAFSTYRGLGANRSLVRTGRVLGRGPNAEKWLAIWSVKYDWVNRAEAWDDERDRIRLEAGFDEVRASMRRFAEASDSLLAAVAEHLQEGGNGTTDLAQLASAAEKAAKVGFLARGQPTSRTSADVKAEVRTKALENPYEDMTDQQLLEELEKEREG